MTEGPKQNTASLSFNTCNPQWCLWRLIFFPLRRPELHTVVFWSPPAVTCHQSSCWEQTWWSWWQFSGEKNQTTEIQLAVRFCFCFLLRPKDAETCENTVLSAFLTQNMQTSAQPKAFWLLQDNFQVTWKHMDTLCSLVWHCVNCCSTEPTHYIFHVHSERPTIHLF